MIEVPVYPLRIEPIYQYRLWGGRRLAEFLTAPLPGAGPVGEAWLLSDRDDHSSKVATGPLKGSTIRQLIEQSSDQILGKLSGRFKRFPVLLKLLDAHEKLSVQVHPGDEQRDYIPAGESGKSEAWVVLESASASRIYAGLKPGTTRDDIERALAGRTIADILPNFIPKVGDAVFIRARTVHSLSGLVVFEVRENSDVTFRLYDWDRIDSKTGKARPLQVEKALACIDYTYTLSWPVGAWVVEQGRRCRCSAGSTLRVCPFPGVAAPRGEVPFAVGAAGEPRVLVCIEGTGQTDYEGSLYPLGKGTVVLLPAAVGACVCRPSGALTLLEIAVPE